METLLSKCVRDFVLHLPASYDPANSLATPLLLDYHGWTRSADIQMDLVPWSQVSDSEAGGFIFVSMDGMNDAIGGGDYGSWNVSATEVMMMMMMMMMIMMWPLLRGRWD